MNDTRSITTCSVPLLTASSQVTCQPSDVPLIEKGCPMNFILSAPSVDGCVETSIVGPEGADALFANPRQVTRGRLFELLSYDGLTGQFLYRAGRSGVRNLAKPAGSINAKGYRVLHIDGREYRAHRMAWLYVHGVHPTGEIDHRNGMTDDNRIANLRDVPTRVNAENRSRAQGYSKTGLLGVRVTPGGRYQAQIWAQGTQHYLGVFDTQEEAHAAYLTAKRLIHPEAVAAFGEAHLMTPLYPASGQAPLFTGA